MFDSNRFGGPGFRCWSNQPPLRSLSQVISISRLRGDLIDDEGSQQRALTQGILLSFQPIDE
jgi:hypothetical protein